MIEPDSTIPSKDDLSNHHHDQSEETTENKLVRVKKSIVFNSKGVGHIDEKMVAFHYYNAFNYSLVARDQKDVNLTLGVTSANAGEGKTLVASNLAVSLSMGYQRKTVLVDLNLQKPRLHDVFGVPKNPGLVEAFNNGAIHVSKTKIDNLSVLSTGQNAGPAIGLDRTYGNQSGNENQIGLEHLASFRDIIYSLEQEFDFVIVDMPSLNSNNFPTLFANQLNGLLVVINAGKTKHVEVEKMFRQINKNQVLGFVFNRVTDEVAP